MTEQWQELRETITELRDNDGTGTQQEVCKFLVNYMEVLEKQMQEPKTGRWQKIEPYPMMEHEYRCSECYHETDNPFENFCSECGARMVKLQGSEREKNE